MLHHFNYRCILMLGGVNMIKNNSPNLNENDSKIDLGQITEIEIDKLKNFEKHPFKVIDETLEELTTSITENGITTPLIVRPLKDGNYEIVSGHRRKRACELAGLDEMPVFIKNLSDDDAAIMMVDANNQREELLYSERAWAYRIKYEAMKHQGKSSWGSSSEQLGKENGKSGRQIKRYIRLTYLQEELLDLVDRKKITFKAAEKLSFLSEKEQGLLMEAILEFKVFPNDVMADKMKTLSAASALDEKQIENVLLQDIQKGKSFSIPAKTIQQYFPEDYSSEDIEKVIIQLLEKWNRGMINE